MADSATDVGCTCVEAEFDAEAEVGEDVELGESVEVGGDVELDENVALGAEVELGASVALDAFPTEGAELVTDDVGDGGVGVSGADADTLGEEGGAGEAEADPTGELDCDCLHPGERDGAWELGPRGVERTGGVRVPPRCAPGAGRSATRPACDVGTPLGRPGRRFESSDGWVLGVAGGWVNGADPLLDCTGSVEGPISFGAVVAGVGETPGEEATPVGEATPFDGVTPFEGAMSVGVGDQDFRGDS